jgi:hypothetical protein
MNRVTYPPLDGPTANEADLDRALFGPYEAEDAQGADDPE